MIKKRKPKSTNPYSPPSLRRKVTGRRLEMRERLRSQLVHLDRSGGAGKAGNGGHLWVKGWHRVGYYAQKPPLPSCHTHRKLVHMGRMLRVERIKVNLKRRSYSVLTHLVPTHLFSTFCHLLLLFTHNLL